MLLQAGCLEPRVIECPWGLFCAADKICNDVLRRCVEPVQLQVCRGVSHGTSCEFPAGGAGYECYQDHGVCALPECGDGLRFASEECDDGNTDDHDGCSKGCLLEQVRWTKLELVTRPPARAHAAMALRPDKGQVILFGGEDAPGNALQDTWALALDLATWPPKASWKQEGPQTPPVARRYHAMVFDAARHRVLLFGGETTHPVSDVLGDTWAFDGVDWAEITAVAGTMAPGFRHAMAWDERRQRAVLFGGGSSLATPLTDVWVLDQRWEKKGPIPDGMVARVGSILNYDARRDRMVMIGGVGGGGRPGKQARCLPDTWELEPGTLAWSEMPDAELQPCLRNAASAHEHLSGTVMLFGGRNDDDEPQDRTWVLSKAQPGNLRWNERGGLTPPTARHGHAMVSLGATEEGGVLLYGGMDATGSYLDDTWVGRFDVDTCGNNIVDKGEGCDGQVFAPGLSCEALGYQEGKLTCVHCAVDTSSCTPY